MNMQLISSHGKGNVCVCMCTAVAVLSAALTFVHANVQALSWNCCLSRLDLYPPAVRDDSAAQKDVMEKHSSQEATMQSVFGCYSVRVVPVPSLLLLFPPSLLVALCHPWSLYGWLVQLTQQQTSHKFTGFAALLFTVLLLAVGPDKCQQCDKVGGSLCVGNFGVVEPGLRERVCGETG